MNPLTFSNVLAPRQSILENNTYNIFQNGNLIAMEQPGRAGFELRNNTNVRCDNSTGWCSNWDSPIAQVHHGCQRRAAACPSVSCRCCLPECHLSRHAVIQVNSVWVLSSCTESLHKSCTSRTWQSFMPPWIAPSAAMALYHALKWHLKQLGCRMQDIVMTGGLVWALPEKGNDVYERFRGVRRPGTNRLIGGGWPLQVLNTALTGQAIA